MDKQNSDDLRQDTKHLLSDALRLSKKDPSSSHLLPSGETKRLLGQLLLNATNGASDKLVVSESRNQTRPPNSRHENEKLIVSYEKRRLLATVKEFSGLISQVTDILEIVIGSYRTSADDLHELLNALQTLNADRSHKAITNRDSQALYALRVKFQNVGVNFRTLQESVDTTNFVSMSMLNNVITQLSNCTRMLIRYLQTLNSRLLTSINTNLSSLYSYSRTIENFLTDLLSHSQFLIVFAFSSGHLPDEHTSEGVKKLAHYMMVFHVEVVQSLEERRHLLSLMSEMELKKRIQDAEDAQRRQIQKQSRLVYHKPDFRPKGFLLPLPLARKREKLRQARHREKAQQSSISSNSRMSNSPVDPRISELERKEQVAPSRKRKEDFEPIPTEPFRFEEIFENDFLSEAVGASKLDVMQTVLSEVSKPAGISESAWRELVKETIEELSAEISSICDGIIDEIFIGEIKKLSVNSAHKEEYGFREVLLE